MPPGGLHDLTSLEQVRTVIANPDPVRRNLQITQSYHELTTGLEPFFGPADRDWIAFATWASKQAGRFIRNEEVPGPLRRFLGLDETSWWRRWLTPSGWLRRRGFLAYLRCTVEEVSHQIGEGNRLVYAKLAPIFAELLALVRQGSPEPQAIDRFLAEIGSDATTGDSLVDAFRSYFAALSEDDPKLRAERIFLGNVLVGWHEQIRLQSAIDGALRAPIQRAFDDPDRLLISSLPIPRALRRLIAGIFRRIASPFIRSFEDEWLEIATECMMTLATPDGVLHLGDDVPPLADGEMFPAALRQVTLPELDAALKEFDPHPDTTRGSGADDWTDLGDRMRFIVDFFRSRQQEPNLLQPPFSPEQAAIIAEGGLPGGRL